MTDGPRDPATEPSQRASDMRAALTDASARDAAGAPDDASVGAMLIASRYRLARELGRGGAAVVWLAHDETEDRQVAVKILRAEVAHTVASNRFLQEIRIVTELSHPRLLPILDSGDSDGLLYHVTPYVEFGSLRARLDRERQLPIADALTLARDVADGLGYAHRAGVIHRDVKPENILLGGDHALVADFGIARALTRAADDRITSTGISVGTPEYMSPEQAAGNTDLDHRTDQYSLGCVLYEMIAGVMPFVGPTPESVIAQRFLHSPHPLRVYRPTVPPHVESAIERAMAMRPADRFPTMSAFADALSDSARASEARVTSPPRPSRARRSVIAGAVAAAIVGAVAVAFTARSRSGAGVAAAEADSTRWVVAGVQVTGAGTSAGDAQRQLADALRRWRDLTVTSAPADANVRDVASRARAGRVVVSRFAAVGDSLELTASLLSARGDTLRRFAARAPSADRTGVARLFSHAGAALTADAGAVTDASDWSEALGTDRAGAWRAYSRARGALARWDLESAIKDLRVAVAEDPQYAAAHLWLAQTLAWLRPGNRLEWQQDALRAMALAAHRATGDSLLAAGVAHLALAEYPDARAAYERARAREPESDVAWFGIAQSQARDDRVVRDSRSPSGWSFRSSYHSAAIAYDSAVAHADGAPAFAFNEMRQLLIIDPFRLRRGRAAPPDTTAFAAHPSIAADTLAFVPHVASAVYAVEPSTVSTTLSIAVRRNADRLAERMREWVRREPQSPRALSALAIAQEVRGEADLRDSGGLAALATLRAASRVSSDSARLVLTASIVRLLVKEERFADAHDLADSLLRANPQPTVAQAKLLAGLAALIGGLGRAERLLAIAESDPATVTATSPPTAVSQSAAHLTAAAALACTPSLASMVRDVEDRIDRYASPENRKAVRRAVLARPLSLAVPCLGAAPLATVSTGTDPLGAMQLAFGRHDPAALRDHFDALMRLRRGYLPGDVALDNTFQEAWLLMAVGDTARAEQHLCVPLSALPTMGTGLVSDVPQAAAVGRSLAFCARAAARRGDAAAAQRWARGLTALWATADAPLQQFVSEIRPLTTASNR